MQKKSIFCIQGMIIIIIMVLSISCVPYNKINYFNDIDKIVEPVVNPKEQKLILPFDKLYIKVLSIDAQTNLLFNSTDELMTGSGSNIVGYLVDEAGNINFPFVGKIKVGGLTTVQSSSKVQEALSEYVSNVSITVKFVDNKVTIMGEVQRQGVFPFSQDKINIYEALALGGGLTRYGDRKNIMLIRQESDKIIHYKLNLSDSKIAGKDYYYIMNNDVIVVEPMKAISWSYNNITFTTVLSTLATFLSLYVLFLRI